MYPPTGLEATVGASLSDPSRSCEKMAVSTAEVARRRERAFCFQIAAPPRLCGEKDLR
jgi:hypothetical protein